MLAVVDGDLRAENACNRPDLELNARTASSATSRLLDARVVRPSTPTLHGGLQCLLDAHKDVRLRADLYEVVVPVLTNRADVSLANGDRRIPCRSIDFLDNARE